MANIGALGIEWHILDAQWFGVAQRRRRVFVIASWDPSAIARSGGKILSVPEDSRGDIKKSRKKRKPPTRASKNGVGESIWYGQSGHGKWSEGGITLAASDYKRPERNFILEPFVKSRRAQNTQDDESWVDNSVAPTLNAFDNTGESRSTVLIVDGTRVNDVRIYDDGIMPTLKHRMGTGGGQVPLIAEEVAIPIQGTIIGRSDTAGPQGKGFGDIGDPSYTLDTVSQHGVMTPELILRRLTPLECERLMGFPDDHTKFADDGKIIADTNRYKMCGNAIASPVAQWIGKELKKWLI
jgi:DNA (cytosine-5)-methyltransferase 1